MTHQPHKRRWFQFRLRTILVVVTLLALPLAWIANERQKNGERRPWLELLESLHTHGGSIGYYDGISKLEMFGKPGWLKDLLDEDLRYMYAREDYLSILGAPVTDAELMRLGGLTKIRTLQLEDTQITDARLVHLACMTNLEVLYLEEPLITDAGLAHLAGLKNLQALNLDKTQVTVDGLMHFKLLTTLRELHLYYTQTTPDERQKLRQAFPGVKIFPEL